MTAPSNDNSHATPKTTLFAGMQTVELLSGALHPWVNLESGLSRWLHIGLRIVGSWIAAISLMLLALKVRG
jgi:hypothetical protein